MGRLLTVTSRMGLCLSCPLPPLAPLHTPVPSGSCDRVGTEDKLQAAAGGKKCSGSGLAGSALALLRCECGSRFESEAFM